MLSYTNKEGEPSIAYNRRYDERQPTDKPIEVADIE
jgi:hypothetical protein